MADEQPVAALAIVRDPAEAERVRSFFADAGLEVGPEVGGSFSVAGPASAMRELFPDLEPDAASERTLSPERLPGEVAQALEAVVTEAPPDFGPGNP